MLLYIQVCTHMGFVVAKLVNEDVMQLSDLSMTCTKLLGFFAAARTGLDDLPAAAVDTAALDEGSLFCDFPDTTLRPVIRPARQPRVQPVMPSVHANAFCCS